MALPEALAREKSRRISQRLLALPEFVRGKTVLAYADFRQEVATGAIISAALARGQRVALPLTVPSRGEIVPGLIQTYPGDLKPGNWGILEPDPTLLQPVAPEEIDVVLAPGVAFDLNGNRLGYGGGYYDRFLPRLGSQAVVIALAFELQIQQRIEPDEHDYAVHYIVTEDRVHKTP